VPSSCESLKSRARSCSLSNLIPSFAHDFELPPVGFFDVYNVPRTTNSETFSTPSGPLPAAIPERRPLSLVQRTDHPRTAFAAQRARSNVRLSCHRLPLSLRGTIQAGFPLHRPSRTMIPDTILPHHFLRLRDRTGRRRARTL